MVLLLIVIRKDLLSLPFQCLCRKDRLMVGLPVLQTHALSSPEVFLSCPKTEGIVNLSRAGTITHKILGKKIVGIFIFPGLSAK